MRSRHTIMCPCVCAACLTRLCGGEGSGNQREKLTVLRCGRIYYEPQTDCSANGEGVIEEVWDDGQWCRVKWDETGETGCYWFSSMWTCLPHATGTTPDCHARTPPCWNQPC